MSATFPCPNAGCKYLFDTKQLPPAAMVTCPLCKTRFPYRAGQVLTAPAAPARASEAPTEPAAAAETAPSGYAYRAPAASGGGAKMALVFVGVTAALGIALLTVYSMVNRNPFAATGGSGGPERIDAFNAAFAAPGKDWGTSTEARGALDINVLSLKYAGADAWAALAARDFQDRDPRPKEAEIEVTRRLRKFLRGPDIQEKADAKATLAGKPARYFIFNGKLNDTDVFGDCHLMVYRGVLYAFFCWAKADVYKEMGDQFAAVRGRLALQNLRDRWTERKSNVQTYFLKNGDYSVSDDEAVWIARMADQADFAGTTKDTFIEEPKVIDEKATVALRGRMPIANPKSKGIDFVPRAEAVVLELGKAADPLAAVKAHLMERLAKKDAVAETKTGLEESKQSPTETELPDAGPKMGRFVSRDPKSAGGNTFYILSALPVGNKTIGCIAECSSRDAEYMEPYMVKLAASLAAK